HDPIELVLIHVSNQQVEGLLHQLETIPDMRVTLLPAAVMALYLPADSAPEQIKINILCSACSTSSDSPRINYPQRQSVPT
ncbi:MAG: hypothetical protein ACFE0J_19850, partial [Elainellaceae cyanobacterium]